jgi:hypothetical protein
MDKLKQTRLIDKAALAPCATGWSLLSSAQLGVLEADHFEQRWLKIVIPSIMKG